MKRAKSLLAVLAMYIVAIGVATILFFFIENPLIRMFVADLAATIVIWIFSLIAKNTSVYDPYWSLIPQIIVFFWFFEIGNFNWINIVFLIVFNIWSLRLTVNWCMEFHSFEYEDWRYRHYRETCTPFLFHLINFFGLQMIPTLLVFLGTMPAYYLFKADANPLSLLGCAIILLGTAFELIADIQMKRFRKSAKEKVSCRIGLWNYSRHPNYLGENLIWIGTYFAMLPADPSRWYHFLGALLILLLFLFVSIPLAERRQLKSRPDYAQYKKETSMILILPKIKRKD